MGSGLASGGEEKLKVLGTTFATGAFETGTAGGTAAVAGKDGNGAFSICVDDFALVPGDLAKLNVFGTTLAGGTLTVGAAVAADTGASTGEIRGGAIELACALSPALAVGGDCLTTFLAPGVFPKLNVFGITLTAVSVALTASARGLAAPVEGDGVVFTTAFAPC